MIELKIDKRSHHFRVHNFSHRAKKVIENFARDLIHWGWLRERGSFSKVPLKTFAASNIKRDEYRFHINQFEDFIKYLANNHISETNYEIYEVELREVEKVELPIFPHWKPREHQVPAIDYIVDDNGPRQRLISMATGQGKAAPLYTSIYTPNGWMKMGDMKIGTEVYTKSGEVTKVNGVYPQGRKDIYEITFQDGRTAECCLEHLWEVYCVSWNKEPNNRKVIDTKEIIRLIKHKELRKRLYVDLHTHPDIPNRDLPIHPYVLGVFLGDGTLGKTGYSISNVDSPVIEKVRSLLTDDVQLNSINYSTDDFNLVLNKNFKAKGYRRIDSHFYKSIRGFDLEGKLSYNKFIPEIYMEGSYSQKLELIQGLLDTDGYVGPEGSIEYSTTSLKMAQQFQYLIRSIGGLCKLKERQTYFTATDGTRKPGRISYRLNIRHNTPEILLSLPRKRDRISKDYQYRGSVRLRIESVRLKTNTLAQCISIEHPSHLYITDDFVVTHNTFISMLATSKLKNRFVMVARPMYLDKWVLDIEKTYDIPSEDILVVRGGSSLMTLLAKAKEGTLTERVILISNKTLQIYIKNYERFGEELEVMGYDYIPDELFQALGGGIRVIDEVHQDFHFNFKLDLYTHTERSVSLSATMLSDDPHIQRMYEIAYPKKDRYEGEATKPYINSIAVLYQFKNNNKIRYEEYGSKTYSHHAFEKSIIRNSEILENYLEMILNHVRDHFVNGKDYKEGDKFIVFCASIDMCTRVNDYLAKHLPQFSIMRYVEDDPYSNLMEPDGRVSTLQSAGTAVDIDQLTHTFLTTAVNSSVSNVQGFGRLRQLKDGRSPTFIYFNDLDSKKHMEYHEKKKEIIKPRSKNFKEMSYGKLV